MIGLASGGYSVAVVRTAIVSIPIVGAHERIRKSTIVRSVVGSRGVNSIAEMKRLADGDAILAIVNPSAVG